MTFYVRYDTRKKPRIEVIDPDTWPWGDGRALEKKLQDHRLKHDGITPAYLRWWLVQIDLFDLLDCAIVAGIDTFNGHPRCLRQLATRGLIDAWQPNTSPEWWQPLSNGADFPREWALIMRPSTNAERPAKWYIDDGSGRALALLRRMLTHQETWRTAWAYLGIIPDTQATFMRDRPELLG